MPTIAFGDLCKSHAREGLHHTDDYSEFSCLCPKTGQPDFATLLAYVPHERCIELKLEVYIWSFRSRGAFHEAVTNEILSDLVAATRRDSCTLAEFNVRGGIYTTVTAEHRQSGWSPPPPLASLRSQGSPGAALAPGGPGICFSIIGLEANMLRLCPVQA